MKSRMRLLVAVFLMVSVSTTQVGCNKKLLKKMKKIVKQVIQVLGTFQLGFGGFLGGIQKIRETVEQGRALVSTVGDFKESVQQDFTNIRHVGAVTDQIKDFGDNVQQPFFSRDPEAEDTRIATPRPRRDVPPQPHAEIAGSAAPGRPGETPEQRALLDRLTVAEKLAHKGLGTITDLKKFLETIDDSESSDDSDASNERDERSDSGIPSTAINQADSAQ